MADETKRRRRETAAAKVARFNEMIGYTFPTGADRGVLGMPDDVRESICVMLREETMETIAALDRVRTYPNTYEVVDGLCDVIVVALGALWKLGVNADVALDHVCESNLTKTPGDVGRGFRRDAVKGAGFRPVNFSSIDDERFFSDPRHDAGPFNATLDGVPMVVESITVEFPPVQRFLHPEVEALPYVLREAAVLRETKAQDYMSGGVGRDDYNPFGIESYVHNVVEKAMRCLSLVRAQRAAPAGTVAVPNHESLRDTLVDLINYASFAVEYIDDKVSDR